MFCIIDRGEQQAIGSLDDKVGEQKVNSSVLQVVRHLFPEHTRGQLFFVEFLKRAAREQSIIPDLEKNTVFINTKSIATLGHELGLSNDTTQKYVKLYIALGLLRKQKFLDRLAFVMLLGIYSPPETLEANLDALIAKSRSRLRDMAQDVKHRCQVYGLIEQGLTQKLILLQTLLQPDKKVSKRTLERRMAEAFYLTNMIMPNTAVGDLSHTQNQVDSSHYLPTGISDKDAKANSIAESTQVTTLAQKVLRQAPQQHKLQLEHNRESTQLAEQNRQDGISLFSSLPMVKDLADAKLPGLRKVDTESMLYQEQDRFAKNNVVVRLPSLTHQVDSIETLQSDESIQIKRLSRLSNTVTASKMSESAVRVDSDMALRNVNVNNIYQFLITYTLREPHRVAEFFAEQLEHDQRVYPKYQKLLFIAEGLPRNPHVLAAAFICTMVRLYRDRWNISNRPGGFFTKRCREYDAGVPPDVEEWIELYGALSPSQLRETLTTSVSSDAVPAPARSAGNKAFPLKQAPAALLPPLTLDFSVKVEATRIVMGKEEAGALVQTILRDDRTRLFRACCVRLGKEQPRYAVLVDASIPGGPSHQAIIYSTQDWQRRLSSMKTWHDLIYPSPHSFINGHANSG